MSAVPLGVASVLLALLALALWRFGLAHAMYVIPGDPRSPARELPSWTLAALPALLSVLTAIGAVSTLLRSTRRA